MSQLTLQLGTCAPILMYDSGYLLHYRWHATKRWISFQNDSDDWSDQIKLEYFKDHLEKQVKKLQKKLKVQPQNTIFCMDSRTRDVWRTKLFTDYKGEREHAEGSFPSEIFSVYYETISKLGTKVFVDGLEADDIAALIVKRIRQHCNKTPITIITSDADYIQLKKYQLITLQNGADKELKMLHEDPDVCKWVKILMGDKSDNISPAIPKCGPKRALSVASDPVKLDEAIKKYNTEIVNNRRLVDFDMIPEEYVQKSEEVFKIIPKN